VNGVRLADRPSLGIHWSVSESLRACAEHTRTASEGPLRDTPSKAWTAYRPIHTKGCSPISRHAVQTEELGRPVSRSWIGETLSSNVYELADHRSRRLEYEQQRRAVVAALHRAADEVRKLDDLERPPRRGDTRH
jgi:hypothetical protein